MSKRRLKNWVEIAEIISAVAVVLSLMYVGFEIRRTTVQSDADVQAELLSYTHQRRYLIIENRDLSDLLAKGYDNPENLTAGEALRFQNYSELLFVAWERALMASEAGVFSAALYNAWDDWFISVAEQTPDFVWPMVRDSQNWNPSFAQHVDEVLGHAKLD
jgi:hypothetical protein